MEMAIQIIWSIAGIAVALVFLFIVPILIEIRKTLKAYRVISDRIEVATDIKSWFEVIKFFRKDKKKK